MLELAMLSPWIVLLFIGAFDWGFYSYALISVQAAARSAALYTSGGSSTASDTSTACNIVVGELNNLRNVTSSCTNPTVSASAVTGPDTQPASQVTVVYTTGSMIPIPGLLAKQFTIRRTVTMRLRS